MSLRRSLAAKRVYKLALHEQMEMHLKENVIQALEENGTQITLRENSAKMKVKVFGFSNFATAIKLGSTHRKLNHSRHLKDGARKKICDYLIILQIDGAQYAVFVELKKTLESKGDPEEQLLRSGPILDYLLSVIDVDEGVNTQPPRIRYALIFEKSKLNKPSLRPDLTGMIDEITYKKIEIKRFLGTEFDLADIIGL